MIVLKKDFSFRKIWEKSIIKVQSCLIFDFLVLSMYHWRYLHLQQNQFGEIYMQSFWGIVESGHAILIVMILLSEGIYYN